MLLAVFLNNSREIGFFCEVILWFGLIFCVDIDNSPVIDILM